jgi:tetratricopeptide (TPR) repeat protein
VADHLETDHAELAKLLREAGTGAFRPGGPRPIDADVVLQALRRLHQRLTLLVLLVVVCSAPARADAASSSILQQATAAYDQGQIERARALYGQAQCPDPDPHLLYNEGNCAYRTGHLGQALALYEKSRRLNPRDSDVLENLNFVRGKLGLPPVGRADTPRQLLIRLRDLLRPDEWCLIGAFAACISLIVAGVRRWRKASSAPGLVAAGLSVLAALLVQWSQGRTTYEQGTQGVVTAESPGAYRLPDAESEKAQTALHTGEPVRIVETRTGWYRVRARDAEAWVRQGEITCVW